MINIWITVDFIRQIYKMTTPFMVHSEERLNVSMKDKSTDKDCRDALTAEKRFLAIEQFDNIVVE